MIAPMPGGAAFVAALHDNAANQGWYKQTKMH
jgi:hypothetical protein